MRERHAKQVAQENDKSSESSDEEAPPRPQKKPKELFVSSDVEDNNNILLNKEEINILEEITLPAVSGVPIIAKDAVLTIFLRMGKTMFQI